MKILYQQLKRLEERVGKIEDLLKDMAKAEGKTLGATPRISKAEPKPGQIPGSATGSPQIRG